MITMLKKTREKKKHLNKTQKRGMKVRDTQQRLQIKCSLMYIYIF